MMELYEDVATRFWSRSRLARDVRLYGRRRALNGFALGLADLIALAASCACAAFVQEWNGGSFAPPRWTVLLLPGWYCGAALFHLLPSWGLGPVEELRRLTLLVVLTFMGTAGAVGISGSDIGLAQLSLATAFVASSLTVPYARTRMKRLLLDMDRWGVQTDVYGRKESARKIANLLKQERGLGYNPGTVYSVDALDISDVPHDGVPGGDGAITALPQIVERVRPAMPRSASIAVLTVDGFGAERASVLLEGPLSDYRSVIVVPELFEVPSLWIRPRDLQGIIGLEIRCSLCRPLSRLMKRTFDVLAVAASLPLWLPLCTLVALLIWLEDRGNPFYLQERVGAGGRSFKTLKFRTMHPDSESILQKALETNPALRDEWTTNFKLRDDPRITRVGRVLRQYSLDEFPQVINVLKGEMSLVGPRPLPSYHQAALRTRVQSLRQRVRPGITGLWQVSGRSDAGNEGLELYDPYYVRNWSLWLDAVILARTVKVVMRGSGAY